MRILSTLLFLISSHSFSAELVCDLGDYGLRVQTDLAACTGSEKSSVVTIKDGMGSQNIEMNCEVQRSSQFVTNENLQSYRDIFLELEFKSNSGSDALLVTNDQTIGYNKGISTLTIGGEEVEFNMMEDCNYGPFLKSFLEIPDQAPQKQAQGNQLAQIMKQLSGKN